MGGQRSVPFFDCQPYAMTKDTIKGLPNSELRTPKVASRRSQIKRRPLPSDLSRRARVKTTCFLLRLSSRKALLRKSASSEDKKCEVIGEWSGCDSSERFWSAVTRTALCAGRGTAFGGMSGLSALKAASRGIPLAAALQKGGVSAACFPFAGNASTGAGSVGVPARSVKVRTQARYAPGRAVSPRPPRTPRRGVPARSGRHDRSTYYTKGCCGRGRPRSRLAILPFIRNARSSHTPAAPGGQRSVP